MEKNIWPYAISNEQVDKTTDHQISHSNFTSLLTRLIKKRTSRTRHEAELGSSEPEVMKLFVNL